jgi:hypothetical protein
MTPDAATSRLLAAGVMTSAGWYFSSVPTNARRLPIAPDSIFVVHVTVGSSGFRIAGRPVPPRMLAKAIRCFPQWRERPVLIVPVGSRPTPAAAGGLLSALAAALGVPVLSSDAGVYVGARILITGGMFRRWNPPEPDGFAATAATGASASTPIGRLLPAPPGLSRHRDPAEPMAAEPMVAVLVEPMTSDPMPMEPVSVEPVSVDPANVEPANVEPAPVLIEHLVEEPAATEEVSQPSAPLEVEQTAPAAVIVPISVPVTPIAPMRIAGIHTAASLPDDPEPEPIAEPEPAQGAQGAHTVSDAAIAAPSTTGRSPSPMPAPQRTAAAAPARIQALMVPVAPVMAPAAVGLAARPVAAPVEATWRRLVSSATREDREQLRSLLGWRYEAHARAITGVLALQPGLRSSTGQDDLLAGLIAVRAHLSTTGPEVDLALRGEPASTGTAGRAAPEQVGLPGARVLARCTGSGLGRLPVVVGPVFRPGALDTAVLSQYKSGTVLVEPAFTEARIGRCTPPDSTVEYAIWSTTGRRTDRLEVVEAGAGSDSARVLFRAGSHFLVLDVDQPTGPGPLRVLLREVPGPTAVDTGADERARQRLRDFLREATQPPADGPGIPQWRLPIGIRSDAAPFALAASE